MDSMLSVNEVSNWLLQNSKKEISPKKLQKLLYYAYGWGLVFLNESTSDLKVKLFEADFQAWVHGPVIPEIYNKYRSYGYNPISIDAKETVHVSEDVEDLLNQILEVYGDYNGNELESMTHQELPWKNARAGLSAIQPSSNTISDEDMFNFFLKQSVS